MSITTIGRHAKTAASIEGRKGKAAAGLEAAFVPRRRLER